MNALSMLEEVLKMTKPIADKLMPEDHARYKEISSAVIDQQAEILQWLEELRESQPIDCG